MRRSMLFLALVVVAALSAACTSSSAPSWTYAAPTAVPSQPAASGSAAPASEAPASSGGAGVGTVAISAFNTAFEQTTVSAPAGTAFVISFNNKDSVPHNIQIKDAGGNSVFKGDIVTGPKQVDYQVPALTAGSYTFVCDVHPNMTGTITAGS